MSGEVARFSTTPALRITIVTQRIEPANWNVPTWIIDSEESINVFTGGGHRGAMKGCNQPWWPSILEDLKS